MKRVSQILVGAAAFFVLVTWWALESDGVAILETTMPSGAHRATHVWFVETGDELWVEAGRPENGWYLDIQETPTISFAIADSGPTRYRALPVPGVAAHERIRAQMRSKYGLRDWWINRIFDTSASIAVRLVPSLGRGDHEEFE